MLQGIDSAVVEVNTSGMQHPTPSSERQTVNLQSELLLLCCAFQAKLAQQRRQSSGCSSGGYLDFGIVKTLLCQLEAVMYCAWLTL